jgi:hypothetical protein
MDTNGFKWMQMDSNGYKWIQMDTNGFKWIQMDSNGFKWIQMDSNGYKSSPVRNFCFELKTPLIKKMAGEEDLCFAVRKACCSITWDPAWR